MNSLYRFRRVAFLSTVIACGAILSAAQPPSVSAVRSETGIDRGLTVTVGIADISYLEELTNNGRMLVHATVGENEDLKSLRELIRSKGIAGLVTVERFRASDRLPYPSDFADLVLADLEKLHNISLEEVKRITIPLGHYYYRSSGSWNNSEKPWPDDFDHWTHYNYNSERTSLSQDKKAGPKRTLKWIDWFERMDHVRAFASEYVSENGNLLHEINVNCCDKRVRYNLVVSRNGFNGTVFWTKERNSGKGYAMVAKDGRFITPYKGNRDRHYLTSFDPRTGEVQNVFSNSWTTEEMEGKSALRRMRLAVGNGIVVQSGAAELRAFDEQTAEQLWTYQDSETPLMRFFAISEAENKVFALVTTEAGKDGWSRWPGQFATAVVCLDLESGEKLWRNSDVAGMGIGQIIYQNGYVFLFTASGIATLGHDEVADMGVLRASDGELLWKKAYEESYKMAFMVDGKPVVSSPNSISWYDPETGDQTRSWENGPNVINQTCVRSWATEKYFIIGHGQYVRDDGTWMLQNITRSDCGSGHLPANGMVYNTPNGCECFDQIRGYAGFSPEPPPPPTALEMRRETTNGIQTDNIDDVTSPRIEIWDPGPVLGGGCGGRCRAKKLLDTDDPWGVLAPPAAPYNETPHESETEPVFTESPIRDSWHNNDAFPGTESEGVTEDGVTYVAVVHEHRMEARSGGTVRWEFHAGARITSPPVVEDNLAIFGAHDGYVYAVDKNDGSLVWKFLAAPSEKRINAYGQLESPWPVYRVTMFNGLATFSAGRHPEIDGGLYIYGVDPQSGILEWHTRLFREPKWRESPESGNKDRELNEWRNVVVNGFLEPHGDHLRLTGAKIYPDENVKVRGVNLATTPVITKDDFSIHYGNGVLEFIARGPRYRGMSMKVFDTKGRELFSGFTKKRTIALNASHLAKGAYVAKVFSKTNAETFSFSVLK